MRIAHEIQDSLELRFSNLARTKNAKGEKIISFGLGEPGFPTPPSVIDAAADAMRRGFTRYSNPFGLIELREKIVDKLARENGVAVDAERIVVTPGAKMALSLSLAALLQPGDEVIVVTPCFPSYIPQIKIAEPDAVVRTVNMKKDGFALDLDGIAAALTPRTRAVIVNFPHNPTGRMISAAEADGLAALLEEHDCFLISDEIYERLNHSGHAHISPAARPALSDRTIIINGFSKAFSMTGWRIGYVTLPNDDLLKIVSRLQQHTNTNTATFIQMAALATFDLPDGFLDDYNARLAANAGALQAVADANPALSLAPSEGGLFAFLDIAASGLGSDAFASGLLDAHNVAATPGIVFGENWDDHLRVSLAIETETFADGADRLDRFARGLVAG